MDHQLQAWEAEAERSNAGALPEPGEVGLKRPDQSTTEGRYR